MSNRCSLCVLLVSSELFTKADQREKCSLFSFLDSRLRGNDKVESGRFQPDGGNKFRLKIEGQKKRAPLYIGANVNGADAQLFNGNLQEIVLYNSDKSSNRNVVENNINHYYSIY